MAVSVEIRVWPLCWFMIFWFYGVWFFWVCLVFWFLATRRPQRQNSEDLLHDDAEAQNTGAVQQNRGATLAVASGSVAAELPTTPLASGSLVTESATRALPQSSTNPGIANPTTVLATKQEMPADAGTTRELKRSKRIIPIVIAAVLVVTVLVAASSYLYFSRAKT